MPPTPCPTCGSPRGTAIAADGRPLCRACGAVNWDADRPPATARRVAARPAPHARRDEPDDEDDDYDDELPTRRGGSAGGAGNGEPLVVAAGLAALFFLLVGGGLVAFLAVGNNNVAVAPPVPAPIPVPAPVPPAEPVAPVRPRQPEPERNPFVPALPAPVQPAPVVPVRPEPANPFNPVGPANPPVSGPVPGRPKPPVEKPPEPLPKFAHPANPYQPGTQTKVVEKRRFALPDELKAKGKLVSGRADDTDEPVRRIRYDTGDGGPLRLRLVPAPKAGLLFLGAADTPLVALDAATGKPAATRKPVARFSDFSLSPDQTALFAADYAGERTGYHEPLAPHHVHRFDLESRTWAQRRAPKIAYKVEAVTAGLFLLLEGDQWVTLTLNMWEDEGEGVTERARIGSGYGGDIEFDPAAGVAAHADIGISSPGLQTFKVFADKLTPAAANDFRTRGDGKLTGGRSLIRAAGGPLYYGVSQVDPANPAVEVRKFPEPVLAASRDLVFTASGRYYVASSAKNFGTLPYEPDGLAVSPDGLTLWAVDPRKSEVVRYALEGVKADE